MVDFKKNAPAGKQPGNVQRPENKAKPKTARKSAADRKALSKERFGYFVIIGCIMIYTAILFSNALHNNFLDWDDNAYVRDNVDIRALGHANIKAMFTNFYVGNWQPLTILSYAVEYSLVGLKSPFLYHVDNLILHLLNVLLVFWLSLQFVKNKWIAALAALLFAIHPLRVESVSWVAERKDVLYSFFFLLSLIFYHKYLSKGLGISRNHADAEGPDKEKATKYYIFIIISFTLSGMAKSAAVVFPVLLILMDYFYRRKFDFKMLIEKIPFFVIALIFGMLALKSQDVAMRDWPQLTMIERVLIVNHSFLRYLFMSFVPVHLSALHPYPELVSGQLPVIYYLALLFTLVLAGLVVYSLKFTRKIAFGILFFLITIVLVLQIKPVGIAIIAERYTYMPHVGLFFVVAFYIVKLWCKEWKLQMVMRVFLGVLVAGWVVLFSATTYSRNTVWKDGMSLWTDVINKYPNSTYSGYYDRGKIKQDLKDTDGAMADYNMAIKLNPQDYKAIINRGIIKQERGQLDSAMVDYNRAIKVNPAYFIVYNDRGAIKKIRNDLEGALADFSKAIELNPNQIESRYNRGTVYFAKNNFQAALEDFNVVLKLQDNYLMTYNYRGACKFNLGDKQGACNDWRRGADFGDSASQTNLANNCK